MTTEPADQQTFDNELRGALFINDKGGNPARPDYRGNCQIAGQKYKISAWKRRAQSGIVFLSMALTAVEPDPPQPPATGAAFGAADVPAPQPTQDDLPF